MHLRHQGNRISKESTSGDYSYYLLFLQNTLDQVSNMDAIKLPYFAPTSELPQPLPTNQEIHEATEQYTESGGRRLVRIGPYMIKYGPGVNVIEGENMLFISRETTVLVPRVYA